VVIALLVRTAPGEPRAGGALVVLGAVQVSAPGLYFPPVFSAIPPKNPPQTIISLPVQTAACSYRPSGALVVLVAVQLSVVGLYLPPVFKYVPGYPRQPTLSMPYHSAH